MREYGVEKVKQKIKLAEGQKNIPESQKLDDLITLSRFQSSRDDAIAEARLLKARLDRLNASKVQAGKPLPKPNEPKTDLERIDQRLEDLRLRWQTVEAEALRIKADADLAAKRFELTGRRAKGHRRYGRQAHGTEERNRGQETGRGREDRGLLRTRHPRNGG